MFGCNLYLYLTTLSFIWVWVEGNIKENTFFVISEFEQFIREILNVSGRLFRRDQADMIVVQY